MLAALQSREREAEMIYIRYGCVKTAYDRYRRRIKQVCLLRFNRVSVRLK